MWAAGNESTKLNWPSPVEDVQEEPKIKKIKLKEAKRSKKGVESKSKSEVGSHMYHGAL